MADCKIQFSPIFKAIKVPRGVTLLEAARAARITIKDICGGDGICGRCKMIVREGEVGGDSTGLLTREEIMSGTVLACQSTVLSDLVVEIPEETRAREMVEVDEAAERFRAARPMIRKREFAKSPLVEKVFLELEQPSIDNNLPDCQRLQRMISRATGIDSIQTGLKVIRRLPEVLRAEDFRVTATVGRRGEIGEIMDVEPGDTSARNFIAVIDMGTSTVVLHLVDVVEMTTVDTRACFNSQSAYGREVTARIMASEQEGPEKLQQLLVEDMNRLIAASCSEKGVELRDVNAAVCAGNTAMTHFLLGLPVGNIRREPYSAVTVEAPPVRAAEVGIRINPRGLLYSVPGISSWVGGDLTAGIMATELDQSEEIAMLIDVGTNGEIVIGNREWLIATSASAGPALEGASVDCGMMAEAGAIERITAGADGPVCETIGGAPPEGLCGSGIIDLVAVALELGIIDRSGQLVAGAHPGVLESDGIRRFVLVPAAESGTDEDIYITQPEIDNVITAKAAIFAAAKIVLDRLKLGFSDVKKLYLAGGFGSYINRENAVKIGLLPDLPIEDIEYVGNTSVWGAKLAALSHEADNELREIRRKTTYYDLMGTDDYVEQFKRAMFLPHTDIELFPSVGKSKSGGTD
jgi:uncharacterized 2Fe-2S/4Fe-4S cluster protein (DUF4445 family)